MSWTPLTWASIGWATVDSTVSALAPGNVVVTVTWGGTMLGNCATGMRVSAISPASTSTIETTKARRGREMKIFGSRRRACRRSGGCRLRCGRRLCGGRFLRRCHHHSGPHFLDALHDDALALFEPLLGHDVAALDGAELDAPLLNVVVGTDNEHVGPGLIELERGLRNQQHLLWLAGLDPHIGDLAGDQPAVGIWELGPYYHGVGALIDLDVEKIHRS